MLWILLSATVLPLTMDSANTQRPPVLRLSVLSDWLLSLTVLPVIVLPRPDLIPQMLFL